MDQLPKSSSSTPSKKDSMAVLKERLETGKLSRSSTERTSLGGKLPEAIRYLAEGTSAEKVVITV